MGKANRFGILQNPQNFKLTTTTFERAETMTSNEIHKIQTRCHWDVTHNGKFEYADSYVPYFWDLYLDGFSDRDDGTTLEFDVNDLDIKIFPELAKKPVVALIETDSGFVIEVDAS